MGWREYSEGGRDEIEREWREGGVVEGRDGEATEKRGNAAPVNLGGAEEGGRDGYRGRGDKFRRSGAVGGEEEKAIRSGG